MVLDQIFLGISANVLTDAARLGWEQITGRTWETLYVDAFDKALSAQHSTLANYSSNDGEVPPLNREKFLDILRRRNLSPATSTYVELTDTDLVAKLAEFMESEDIVVIGGHNLSKQDYLSLLNNVAQHGIEIFRRTIRENPKVFPQAALDLLEANHDLLKEMRGELAYQNAGIQELVQQAQATSKKIDYSEYLETSYRISIARCIERWQATGLALAEAREFANDTSIANPPETYLPTSSSPIRILVAELGTGKSLIAERAFQAGIKRAEVDSDAPIPIYLQSDAAIPLQETIETILSQITFDRNNGVNIIIDEADMLGIALALDLLAQARILVNSWNKTTVLITSRPIPSFGNKEEVLEAQPLTEEQTKELVQKIIGDTSQFWLETQPEAIKDALKRPLFALLYGVYRREHYGTPYSISQLISSLVSNALRKSRVPLQDLNIKLEQLAIKSISRAKNLVVSAEIASPNEVAFLLDSQLLIRRGEFIGFALPILTQWFAAQSLANGYPNPDSLANEPQSIDRWRYPLALLIGNYDYDKVSNVISPLVKSNPAFVSQVLKDGLTERFRRQEVSIPTLQECREQISTAMKTWINGIGSLAKLIAPIKTDGTLADLNIRVTDENSWIHTHWEFELMGTLRLRSGAPALQPAWSWKWTLEDLVDNLEDIIAKRGLPVVTKAQEQENLWEMALTLVDKSGYVFLESIPLDTIDKKLSEVEKRLTHFSGLIVHAGAKEYRFDHSNVTAMRRTVGNLMSQGESEFHSPYPGADLKSQNIYTGSEFSSEQMLKRVFAVLANAIEIYEGFVNNWFSQFRLRFRIATTLPASLKVTVASFNYYHSPSLDYYFDPLPKGSKSTVEIKRGRDAELDGRIIVDEVYERLHKYRPEAREWIGARYSRRFFSDWNLSKPATELAYEWLWEDLVAAGWAENFLPTKR